MFPINVTPVSALLELIPLTDPAPKVVTASDWASVITAMTSQISVTTVVGVLATLVTAGIGLVFLWWGVRKAVGEKAEVLLPSGHTVEYEVLAITHAAN